MSTQKMLQNMVDAEARDANVTNFQPELENEYGDYFDNENYQEAYDVIYHVRPGDPVEILGVEIAVAVGGPGIYINTRTKKVEGYWAGATAEASLDHDVAEAIGEYFMELYEFE